MKSLQKSFIIITVLAFGGAAATPALALSAANYSASLSIVAQLVDIANVHAEYRASIVPAVSAYLTTTAASADLANYPLEQANIKAAASLVAMAHDHPNVSDSVLPQVKASLTASSAAFASLAPTQGTGGIKPIPPTTTGSADMAVKYAQTLSTVQQLVDLAVASPSASASIVSSLAVTLNTLQASADLAHFPKELAEIKAAASLVASIKAGQASADVVLPSIKATIASSQNSFAATAATAGTGGIKPIPPTTTANPNAAVTYASTLATVNQLVDLAVANPKSSDDIVSSVAATLNTLAASADLVHYPAELAEIKAAAALVSNIKSGQASSDNVWANVKATLTASQSQFANLAATAATAGTGGVKPIPTNTSQLSADAAVRAQLSANTYANSLAVIKQIIDLGEGSDLSTDSIIKSVSTALDNLAASADLAQFPNEQAEIKALAALAASVKNNPAAADTVLPNIKASLSANTKKFASLSASIKATTTNPNSFSALAALRDTGYVSLATLQSPSYSSGAINLGLSDSAGQFITTGCFTPSFTSSEQISYNSTGSKDAMSPVLKNFLSVYCKSIL